MDNSGPAFTRAYDAHSWAGPGEPTGLTKREWFAAHAPEVPKWFYQISGDEVLTQKTLALWAFSYADAMIQESSK